MKIGGATINTFLTVIGAIITIGGGIAAIDKWIVKPIQFMTKELEKIDKLDEGQKVLMKATAQTMEHIISGNNIDELKVEYDNLIDYCIDK